ncbi:archaeal proteasome endopeptidase complex subunit alpha [archaeon]|jgi:proteasome alpha subunit|nr:archaeal proteasome endopeptidase complex subunit alpha [archaeon]MBT4397812.1 archaeal proteasome endopeptidase complex subunit alpha [archaeon]MBT4441146.1 archaeal proteasome endopeptidase complex subunit alpha [archaeon]
MQEGAHQMMGYDRASTMFSPDGRLLQVEYAKEAVKQGSTAIGIVCSDGAVLIADKRISDELIISDAVEKIFQVDKHMGATSVGYVMDGRVLIERAQVISQQHMVTYTVPMETLTLVKEISDTKQSYTQYGGARPFGVSILFIGVDDGPVLYVTEPTGIFFQFRATAVGENSDAIKNLLRKEYKEEMNTDDGIKLAIKALKKVMGKDFDARRIDGAVISTSDKQFRRIDKKRLK